MNLKEYQEKRAEAVKEMQRLAQVIEKEGRSFTDEERTKWDAADETVKQCDTQIAILERARQVGETQPKAPSFVRPDTHGDAGIDAEHGKRTKATEEHRTLALASWFKRNGVVRHNLSDEEEEACKIVGFNPDSGVLDISLRNTRDFNKIRNAGWGGGHGRSFAGAEERALSAVTGSTGGLLVPETMVNSLEINMLAYGGILQAVDTITTASGEPMSWPTADDTSNTGVQVGESAAVTTADPSFGAVVWNAYKFSSKEIKVPYELLEDSVFDLPGVLGEMLGERLGRILNTKFTTGNGVGTPKGLTTGLTTGKTTTSSTAITWDEITDLIHSIDPAYRSGSSFMFHDNVFLALRKLKDGEGRPLWADGPNSTPPPTLQGYPYYINQDMSSAITTGLTTMTFGQHSKYKVRRVNGIRFYRLVERHRENDQDAFLAFVRADGNLLDAGTAPVKAMVQA